MGKEAMEMKESDIEELNDEELKVINGGVILEVTKGGGCKRK